MPSSPLITSSPAMSLPDRLLIAAILCAGAPAAQAQTRCSSGSASLSLGTYSSDSTVPVDSSVPFIVTCTRSGGPRSTTVTVGLGPSFNSGRIAQRHAKLTSGPDTLNYNLFRDASRFSVWGETMGVDTVSQTIDLANKTSDTLTFNIFARIPAGTDVRAGFYTDQLTITVYF